jgi:hypothetical protein
VKSIAIMQPYFLPYIGYFQLIAAVDKFIVFDDVNFINRGWINRNRILVSGRPYLFTLPIRSASQNRLIHELELANELPWREKLLRTFFQAYRRAPHFKEVSMLIEDIIQFESHSLGAFVLNSIAHVATFLEIQTELVATSRVYANAALSGEDRILDICRIESASTYVNAIGGFELYQKAAFTERGVSLQFLETKQFRYSQLRLPFVDKLSIADVLMFNGKATTRQLLSESRLVS